VITDGLFVETKEAVGFQGAWLGWRRVVGRGVYGYPG